MKEFGALKKWDLFNSPIVDNCWLCPTAVVVVVAAAVEGCWTRHCCGSHLGSALTWSLAARSGRPSLLSSGWCGPGLAGAAAAPHRCGSGVLGVTSYRAEHRAATVPTVCRLPHTATTTPRCRGLLGHSPQPSFVEHGAASWERGLPLQQPCRPVLVVHDLWCSVLSLRYWYLCSVQWWTMINCWYLQCHVGIPTHREGGGARHILHQ